MGGQQTRTLTGLASAWGRTGSGTTERLWALLQGRRGRGLPETSASGGEILVARMRLGVILAVASILLAPAWTGDERRAGLGFAGLAVAYALGVLLAVRPSAAWLGPLSSVLDGLLATAALLAVSTASGRAGTAAWAAWGVHLLLIVLAGLRFNWRLPVASGGLATAGYLAVCFATAGTGPDTPSTVDVVRVVLLLTVTLLSAALVVRGSRLRELSSRDALTRLLNRGAFEERLAEEVRRAHRHRRPLALAVLDADHFKQLNDTFGHAAGDAALRDIGTRLRRDIRDTDVAARIGGEEFAILLPEADVAAAAARIKSLLEGIASTPVRMRWGTSPRVTASAGVTALQPFMTPLALLARADDCLYEAKRRGRNCVVAAGTERELIELRSQPGSPAA